MKLTMKLVNGFQRFSFSQNLHLRCFSRLRISLFIAKWHFKVTNFFLILELVILIHPIFCHNTFHDFHTCPNTFHSKALRMSPRNIYWNINKQMGRTQFSVWHNNSDTYFPKIVNTLTGNAAPIWNFTLLYFDKMTEEDFGSPTNYTKTQESRNDF